MRRYRQGRCRPDIQILIQPPPPTPSKLAQVHATVLQPEDVWRGYNFGGKWVFFEPHEIKEMGKALTTMPFQPHPRPYLSHHFPSTQCHIIQCHPARSRLPARFGTLVSSHRRRMAMWGWCCLASRIALG